LAEDKSQSGPGTNPQARGESHIHLAQGPSHLGPDGVDVIVESLEGKNLELGFFVGQEGQDTGCCDKARHCVGGGPSRRSWEGCLSWAKINVDCRPPSLDNGRKPDVEIEIIS